MRETSVFEDIDPKHGQRELKGAEKIKERIRGGFKAGYESAKQKFKERQEFNQEVREARQGAYKKQRLVEARKQGRERARRGPLSGLQLNRSVVGGEGGTYIKPRRKSNLERLMGL